MGQSKGSRIGDSKASLSCLAETRYVDMLSVDLFALKIGLVLSLERNCEIQSGIEKCVAVLVFVLPGVKSCKSCLVLSARKVQSRLFRTLLAQVERTAIQVWSRHFRSWSRSRT